MLKDTLAVSGVRHDQQRFGSSLEGNLNDVELALFYGGDVKLFNQKDNIALEQLIAAVKKGTIMKIPLRDEPPVPSDPADEYPLELFAETLHASEEFQNWTPEADGIPVPIRHNRSPRRGTYQTSSVRLLFMNEPGVVRFQQDRKIS